MQNPESLPPANPAANPENPDESASVLDRRAALGKLGKLAYTAPALMTLLFSDRASAVSLCPGTGLPPDPGGNC